ncbi:MAG: hypothetical protein J1E83_03725 [Lachnospiraceae bacterium]|nr:hypothetical protein [Lachnospiraceae bacterium]
MNRHRWMKIWFVTVQKILSTTLALIMIFAGVLSSAILPASVVLASEEDMSVSVRTDGYMGTAGFFLQEMIQRILCTQTMFEGGAQEAEEDILKEGKLLYETYIPALDQALLAYRENAMGEVSYAAYDRFFYYDNYSLPVGKLTLFSEDGDYTGLRAQIQCAERFCSNAKEKDVKQYILEYYELPDISYFSFLEEGGSATKINLPYFMCVQGMEHLYAIEENGSLKYTVYGNKYFTESISFSENMPYSPDREELRELIRIDTNLYIIDRERGALILLTAKPDSEDTVFVDWIQDLKALCHQDIMVGNSVSAEELQAYLPNGYTFWHKEPVTADINEDGYLDVLAVLIPVKDSYEWTETQRMMYEEGSPYIMLPEYYYQELWYFAGQPNGGYRAFRIIKDLEVVSDVPGNGEYNRNWDILSLIGVFAFPGGFTLEYFVGRAPFQNRLINYAYGQGDELTGAQAKDAPSFQFAGITYNDIYEDAFIKLGGEVLGENKVSLNEQHIMDNYIDFLWRYESGGELQYTWHVNLINLSDAALAEKINTLLAKEADRLFAAADTLGVHDILLTTDLVFANSNVLIFSFSVSGRTGENKKIMRNIPITIDLRTGEVLNYRDYLTEEELQELFFCEWEACNAEEALRFFSEYDNYERLLNPEEISLTLHLTQEGLLLYSTRKDEESYLWQNTHLLPRSCFLGSPLAALWDDWPGEMY